MYRIFISFFTILILISCNKSEENIYELNPDKDFYFVKKENGDSMKVFAEPFRFNYSKPKYLIISRFNKNINKFEVQSVLLKVKQNYYNYFNLKKKDSLDENSFVFLTKQEKIIENEIEPKPISYWKKSTEIFKKEDNGVYSRELFFTSPNNYKLDFGTYYYDEDFRIFKIVEIVGNDTITYEQKNGS
ncbi:hypothetical protein [Chryseobacterium sp. VAUSW3]|uniref:hypothetical protein n=1 Tax=Chryseobacterium sp. VAUSW3 TaxID=2010998 RepID=UPI000B4CEE0C|nr:hypothetical protein [Chryseobacterium sp. VAUSW3]OWR14547.1 hypothetical protein CDW55_09615 [Chryseobacterium sp. VAUSW3]